MRRWKNNQMDDGGVHCLGNGRLAVYEQGPDIIQVFGPPYSTPSFMKLILDSNENMDIRSQREQGTAVWKQNIYFNGNECGEMVDFIDPAIPCFMRRFHLLQPMDLLLEYEEVAEVIENTSRFAQWDIGVALQISVPPGEYIYAQYPLPFGITYQILVKGPVRLEKSEGKRAYTFCIGTGEGCIYIIGGPSYPECIYNSEEVLAYDTEKLLLRTIEWWKDYSRKRRDFAKILPEDLLRKADLLDAIDSVSVLLKTQQAIEGGVLAGHKYHLGYVRDQYGVSRCLLKLGYHNEAKAILGFYWKAWKRWGCIHNAQALGVDGVFHVHENDEVEITGYLIIQAFDYHRVTGDNDFIKEILPMLEWAWDMQKKNLVIHMLPFNGDETYIAGGILPRTVLNDGSAEATLLFVTAGEQLLKWIGQNHIWTEDELAHNIEILKQTSDQYRSNFWEKGMLATNQPGRKAVAELPRFRHGVCEGILHPRMQDDSLHNEKFWFGWIEKCENGRYLCHLCISNGIYLPGVEGKYYLQSVALMPLYINSLMFTKDEIYQIADNIILAYRMTGRLPSRPDGNISVGYDYGLLLYTLTETGHPIAQDIYLKTLDLLDSVDAWTEYYEDGKATGCQYRPWESGINMEAILHFAEKYGNRDRVL